MLSNSRTKSAVINILQITDCHLTKHEDGDLLGVKTRESLDAVLSVVNARNEQPDYILATGDLAQDASEEAYSHFKSKMQQFNCPVGWFPGNHDQRDAMKSVVGDGQELQKVIQIGDWQIVMLDSLVEGKVHGWLQESELELLDKTLSSDSGRNTMVCLHHHPVDIKSKWLDNIGLHNRDQFWETVDKYPNVKAILWGHIHQELNDERNGVKLMASPSTCIQFLPKSEGFAVEDIAPGYRWLRLYPDGKIDSAVVRAEDYDFQLDMQSTGY